MEALTILLEREMRGLQGALAVETERLRATGIPIETSAYETSSLQGCSYVLPDRDISPYRRELEREAFYQGIIKCVQHYFFAERAKIGMQEILMREYAYFEEEERRQIFVTAEKLLAEEDTAGYFRRTVRKKLEDCLQGCRRLHVTGFLRFRVKNYTLFLEKIVALAAESYVEMVEYKEFVEVLQYFVAQNTPQAELVQVIEQAEEYLLLDREGEELEGQKAEIFGDGAERKAGETLVSMLINLSPESIVFHQRACGKDETTIKLLQNIFGEKMTICEGCSLCGALRCLDSDLV